MLKSTVHKQKSDEHIMCVYTQTQKMKEVLLSRAFNPLNCLLNNEASRLEGKPSLLISSLLLYLVDHIQI